MTKSRILIVNDDPDIVNTLSSILRARNYVVSTAPDGMAGLEKAKTERPDLVFLDTVMPDGDGYSVCAKLRADRATRNIPVIMVSADGESESVLRARAAGANDYIVQPFNLFTLLNKLKRFLAD